MKALWSGHVKDFIQYRQVNKLRPFALYHKGFLLHGHNALPDTVYA